MKTLIYGAGPIGQWLAMRLSQVNKDVTLLARGNMLQQLQKEGVAITDGFTGERQTAQVTLVDRLDPNDHYDLVIVPMRKSSRLAVCRTLAANDNVENILFLGNDISGFHRYFDCLPKEKVLLGFPGVGGGIDDGDDLVIVDREKPDGKTRSIYIGELTGEITERMKRIKEFFKETGIPVSLEKNIDGWLKYHFAFVGPMVAIITKCGGDVHAVASNKDALRHYVMACREAGNVLRKAGYPTRQPPIFNLFYWLPLWLAPKAFKPLFDSRFAEVAIGLHAKAIGNEFAEMADEFEEFKTKAGIDTQNLDKLLHHIPRDKESIQ